jgi:hypothetical protein
LREFVEDQAAWRELQLAASALADVRLDRTKEDAG